VESHTAFISVGSNLGKKLDNCNLGINALDNSDTSRVIERSPFYKTEPIDYTAQDWFVNAAFKLETTLEPLQLLDELKKIQRQAGREKDQIRFGPRILDLDIIFYDELVIESDELIIPHPRMHKRRFVLKPICDIDPTFIHPILNKEIRFLLNKLEFGTQQIEPLACDS
jgi:2-amino-4-hydroxy-6-hydroxymethyldihydropteridine diphosphokinase